MAWIVGETFDGCAAYSQYVGTTRRWREATAGRAQIDAGGRTGQAMLGITTSVGPAIYLPANVLGTPTEIFAGMGVYVPSVSTARGLFTLRAQDQSLLARIETTSAGKLRAVWGPGTTTTDSAGTPFTDIGWYFVEIRYKLADSPNGVLELRVENVSAITQSGVDTKGAAQTSIGELALGGSGVHSQDVKWDDVYVCDASGAAPTNTYLGRGFQGTAKRPNANGATSQWTGSDGNSTDNYLNLDEQSVNDADFVHAAVDGFKDTYGFEDLSLPTGHSIIAVQHSVRAAWAASQKKLALVTRGSGGSEEDSADITLTSTLTDYLRSRETKVGGGAWTEAEWNGGQLGHKQRP